MAGLESFERPQDAVEQPSKRGCELTGCYGSDEQEQRASTACLYLEAPSLGCHLATSIYNPRQESQLISSLG